MENSNLEEQIRKRIEEASRKKIFDKAEHIVKTLGNIVSTLDEHYKTATGDSRLEGGYTCPESGMKITYHHTSCHKLGDRDTTIQITNGAQVFFGRESYRMHPGETNLRIEGYIPGVWEQLLERSYITSQVHAEADRLRRDIEQLKTTPNPRVAFGLFEK